MQELKEADISCPLPSPVPEMELYSTEDPEEVLGRRTDQYPEELLGLPLAMYTRKTEEPEEMDPGGIVGSSPGTLDVSLVVLPELGQYVLMGFLLTQWWSNLPLSRTWWIGWARVLFPPAAQKARAFKLLGALTCPEGQSF